MSIPTWPITLPQAVLLEGFSLIVQNNILMSQADAGFGKRRNKGATPPAQFTRTLQLTDAQLTTFLNFVEFTLRNGTLRFETTHPRTGATVELLVVPQGETLFPPIVKEGKLYKVNMKLQVMP